MCRAAIWCTSRAARCAPSAFDLERLQTVGTAIPVVPQVVTLPTGTAEFDVAADGTLVYVAGGAAAGADANARVGRSPGP